jgi:hypothetical protein
MKTTNINMINELQAILRAKTDRINHINKIVAEIRKNYPTMTTNELIESIHEVRGLEKELAQHKEWCAWAKDQISRLFAPAMKEIAA